MSQWSVVPVCKYIHMSKKSRSGCFTVTRTTQNGSKGRVGERANHTSSDAAATNLDVAGSLLFLVEEVQRHPPGQVQVRI